MSIYCGICETYFCNLANATDNEVKCQHCDSKAPKEHYPCKMCGTYYCSDCGSEKLAEDTITGFCPTCEDIEPIRSLVEEIRVGWHTRLCSEPIRELSDLVKHDGIMWTLASE